MHFKRKNKNRNKPPKKTLKTKQQQQQKFGYSKAKLYTSLLDYTFTSINLWFTSLTGLGAHK